MSDIIKVSLKEEVKKQLLQERENRLFESLLPISECGTKDEMENELCTIGLKLMSEGYTPNDITETIKSNSDVFSVLTEQGFDFSKILFGAGKSEIFEQIMRWIFVNVLGFKNEGTAQDIAILLSEYNPLNILKLFKDRNGCIQEVGGGEDGNGLGMALIEMFINRAQFGGEKQHAGGKGFFKVGLRNVVAEAVRESNLDEKLAGIICGYIWDADNKNDQTNV